jgi:hypothetical protein
MFIIVFFLWKNYQLSMSLSGVLDSLLRSDSDGEIYIPIVDLIKNFSRQLQTCRRPDAEVYRQEARKLALVLLIGFCNRPVAFQ